MNSIRGNGMPVDPNHSVPKQVNAEGSPSYNMFVILNANSTGLKENDTKYLGLNVSTLEIEIIGGSPPTDHSKTLFIITQITE